VGNQEDQLAPDREAIAVTAAPLPDGAESVWLPSHGLLVVAVGGPLWLALRAATTRG
jgi:hypothetical protein